LSELPRIRLYFDRPKWARRCVGVQLPEARMKRGCPAHPKVAHLCKLLNISLAQAVGHLELLFHATAQYTPRGDIGKYPDEWIEAVCGWITGRWQRQGQLIEALSDANWLEVHTEHRLIVHDWAIHADESVRKKLARAGLNFVSGAHQPSITGRSPGDQPSITKRSPMDHIKTDDNSESQFQVVTYKVTGKSKPISRLPEPEPEPEPAAAAQRRSAEKSTEPQRSDAADAAQEEPSHEAENQMRAMLRGYVRYRDGRCCEPYLPEPDHDIVAKCEAAVNGAAMSEVKEYLQSLNHGGRVPRSWGFFAMVLAERFAKRKPVGAPENGGADGGALVARIAGARRFPT
jgi:hypothetical protein